LVGDKLISSKSLDIDNQEFDGQGKIRKSRRAAGVKMSFSGTYSRARMPVIAALASLILTACGGGADTAQQPEIQPPPLTTGIVGVVITDKPTDNFSAINLDIEQAILIGGDDGQEMLFEGPREINLLDLTNYSEPVLFERIDAATYTKLRLIVNNLELVSLDGTESWYPNLPGNGKIDLLDQDGFVVLPGRTIIIEVDIDANKSIKVTGAGNGTKYQFRPVVKVDILDGGLQDKLARIEGFAAELYDDPAGSFRLCHAIEVDNCIDIRTGDASVFDMDGLPTDMSALMVDDPVVVIGRYGWDDSTSDIWLDAIVVEIGGNAVQVKGNVVSDPVGGQFLMQKYDDTSVTVELQVGTRYFDSMGETGAESIALGTDLEIEGVMAPKAAAEDPDVIRAALVFVMPEDADQASGTIADEPDAGLRSFMLTPEEGNDMCVNVAEDASVLLVNVAASEVLTGSFDDLAMDQMVDLFGTAPDSAEGCFTADEVIVGVVDEGGGA